MSLRYGLLGLLKYQDMSGYDLAKAFDTSLQFMWNAKSSQIYRELSKLEEEGWVKSHVEEQERKFDKKVYAITGVGESEFNSWIQNFPNNLQSPIRDEFMLRIFFSEALEKENLVFELIRFKKQREEALVEISMAQKIAKESAEQADALSAYYYWALTIKKGIKEIKAEIECAEETIEELKRESR